MYLLLYLLYLFETKKVQQVKDSFLQIDESPEILTPKTDVELTFYCNRNLFMVLHTTYVLGIERRYQTEGNEFRNPPGSKFYFLVRRDIYLYLIVFNNNL